MSDIEKILRIEDEQLALIDKEKQTSRERISRVEADAAFRVAQGLKEKKQIIDDLLTKGKQDAEKEVVFIKEEETANNQQELDKESRKVSSAVSYMLGRIRK